MRHANLDLDDSGSAERNRALKFVTLHELLAGLQKRDVKALAVQERAYAERNDQLANAWRSPNNPPPPPLKKGQSPRDAYIERVTNA